MTTEELASIRRLARSGLARDIRQKAGISLVELATEIGASPAALSRWERGQRSPRPDVAARYAAALKKLTP